ncbi:50S ribosomal protein L25 [bacterium]|nr:50S ribosomal protein L25 [bacterium]
MDVITLEAKARLAGKTAAKAARREDSVPCVLYGHGIEPRSFQVKELSLRDLIYTDEFHKVSVDLEGTKYDCVLKDVDFHPVTDRVIHADFQALNPKEMITIKVPVHYTGNAPGVRNGGSLKTFVHKISIKCLPENLPDFLEVDISKLKIGQSILVRTFNVPGLEIKAASDQTLVSIIRPRVAISLDEDEDEEGAATEGAESTEGGEGESES